MTSAKKRILILGAGVMQGPAIRCAKAMGLETVVVDGDPFAPLAAEADRFEPLDLKDIHKIEQFARTLQTEGGLHGVMTAGTDFSASVAFVAEKLNLPGIPYETALDASDKERMRKRFEEAGLPSPAFTVFTKENAGPASDSVNPASKNDNLEGSGLPFPFPVVVKPVDNMGARGCRRVDNEAELRAAVETALRFSRSGRAIVEEYMEGPEFSVDAVIYRGKITICGLADRHIFYPPYFIEMGHTMPSDFPQQDQERIIEVFIRGIKALGIENGAAKGDIKLTKKGPMIGEIAARLSGGYMSGWTYPYASGANPARGAICVALGLEPEGLNPKRNWISAERAFISIPGIVHSIEGLDEAKSLPYIKDIFLRSEKGKRVAFPENNVTKAGNVISAAPDRQSAVQAAEKAVKTILIRLAVPDEETEAFLNEYLCPSDDDSCQFPPSAYMPGKDLLEQLPQINPGINPLFFTTNHHEPSRTKKVSVPLSSFPAFVESDLTDYVGRSPRETLESVKKLTGLEFSEPQNNERPVLGREFWQALIRGGYQGAVYYIDRMYTEAGLDLPYFPAERTPYRRCVVSEGSPPGRKP